MVIKMILMNPKKCRKHLKKHDHAVSTIKIMGCGDLEVAIVSNFDMLRCSNGTDIA